MSKVYHIQLTISGLDPHNGKAYGFSRIVGAALTRQKAEEKYSAYLSEHHFQGSVNHGVFLSIRKDGDTLFRQQIN